MTSVITVLIFLLLAWAIVASVRLYDRFRKRSAQRRPPEFEDLKRKARAGDADAQYQMGVVCLERSDDAEGAEWFLKSAGAGKAAAQDAIGMLHELGRGVPKNYEEAARWYTSAARQGFADGEVNLGYLYTLGRGVAKDFGEALRWFDRAAKEGHPEGRTSLAWLLATCPDGSIRDGQRAIDVLGPLVDAGEKQSIMLDTLAAAYAETGAFSKAQQLVKEALAGVDQSSGSPLYGQMERRLRCYEMEKPWHEPPEEDSRPRTEGIAPRPSPAAGPPEEDQKPSHGSPGPAEAPDLSWADEPSAVKGPANDVTVEFPRARDAGPTEKPRSGEGPADSVPEEEVRGQDSEPQPNLDYIVEKLLVIEKLLRPLKTEEVQRPDDESASNPSAERKKTQDGASVGSPTRVEGPVDESLRDRQKAVDFGLSLVEAMINDEYGEVYKKMERAFRNAVPEDQIEPMIEQMYASYGGKPLEAELKAEEASYRMYAGEQKQVYKFWYALRTSEHEKGTYSLFVEILPEENHLACSSFFITPTAAKSGK